MMEEEPRKIWHEDRVHQGNSLGAVILISAGLIFLLNNFGIIPWAVWGVIWRFWPLGLVLVGLQLAFGRSGLANFITTLVGLILLTLALAFAISVVNPAFNDWIRQQFPWWNINLLWRQRG